MNEITLHQPPTRAWGTPNLSPFCIKLETYLRIAEVPYKLGKFSRGDAPKGKVPYVRIDGAFMGDSHLIIQELERRLGDKALDRGLAAHDAAIGHVVRRTLEEAFYFVGVYLRWDADDGYVEMAREFKKFVPGFVVPLVRRAQRKKLHEQGTGRHTREQVMEAGIADVTAIAELLGDKPFLAGDAPRTFDCTLFAFLEAVIPFPVDSPLKQALAKRANLTAYRDRIRARWWADLS
jgi:glutathione S-transferase